MFIHINAFVGFCTVCEGVEELWRDVDESEAEFLDEQLKEAPPSLPQDESDSCITNTQLTRSLVLWLTVFLQLLQTKHFIPDAAMSALLKVFVYFSKF